MLEYWIAEFRSREPYFLVPADQDVWKFVRRSDFDQMLGRVQYGQVLNTFFVSNPTYGMRTDDELFGLLTDDLVDVCLVLSFLNCRSVTVTGTTPASEGKLMQPPDKFIRARAIDGFDIFESPSLTDLFKDWQTATRPAFRSRGLRLQLSHWLSGLTCFTLEDLFISASIQMDMVKQQEIAAGGGHLTYFKGMQSASARYGLTELSHDATKMRNDLLHAGKLSDANFVNKTKADAAAIVAETMNWLDEYVLAILGFKGQLHGSPRWKPRLLEHALPAVSLP